MGIAGIDFGGRSDQKAWKSCCRNVVWYELLESGELYEEKVNCLVALQGIAQMVKQVSLSLKNFLSFLRITVCF
ncbi:MAG: hypothetical protein V8S95_02190 [Odoribacter sp.]